VILSGTKDNVLTTFGFWDHPKNIGYPGHSHARDYGLFSTNNLGSVSYNKDHEKIVVTLEKVNLLPYVIDFIFSRVLNLQLKKRIRSSKIFPKNIKPDIYEKH